MVVVVVGSSCSGKRKKGFVVLEEFIVDSIIVTSIEQLFCEFSFWLFPDCYIEVLSSVIVEQKSLIS